MTTPDRSNPKRAPSTDAAGASRSRMGRMENADFLKKGDQMGNPGPGAYRPSPPSERDRGPSFSFGSRQGDIYPSNSPGPCYGTPPPSSLSPGPKFSITSRHMPSRFAIAIEED